MMYVAYPPRRNCPSGQERSQESQAQLELVRCEGQQWKVSSTYIGSKRKAKKNKGLLLDGAGTQWQRALKRWRYAVPPFPQLFLVRFVLGPPKPLSPEAGPAGVKHYLQFRVPRPAGHTGVRGTRWGGFEGAEGKAFICRLRSQWSEDWKKVNVTPSSSRRARRRIQTGLTSVPAKVMEQMPLGAASGFGRTGGWWGTIGIDGPASICAWPA